MVSSKNLFRNDHGSFPMTDPWDWYIYIYAYIWLKFMGSMCRVNIPYIPSPGSGFPPGSPPKKSLGIACKNWVRCKMFVEEIAGKQNKMAKVYIGTWKKIDEDRIWYYRIGIW